MQISESALYLLKPNGVALGLISKSYRDYFWVKRKERFNVLTYSPNF